MSLFPRHIKGDPALAAERKAIPVDIQTELRNLGICLSIFVLVFAISAFLVYRLIQTRVLGTKMTEYEWVTKYRYDGHHHPIPDRPSVSASASAEDSNHSGYSRAKSDIKIMVSPSSPTSPLSSPTLPAPASRGPTTTSAAAATSVAAPALPLLGRSSNTVAQRRRTLRRKDWGRERGRMERRQEVVESVVEEEEEEEEDEETEGEGEETEEEEEIEEVEAVEREEGGRESREVVGAGGLNASSNEAVAPTASATAETADSLTTAPVRSENIIGADSAIAATLCS